MSKIAYLVATLASAGRFPIASGTFGTLVFLPVAYALSYFLSDLAFLIVFLVIFGLGTWSAGVVEATQGKKDPGVVVIDEAAGLLATVAFLSPTPLLFLSAFFLFRILDILKPPPARWAESLPGGLGIMADDVLVGIYGNLALRAGLFLSSGA